jgi:hypothetical protein
MVVIAEPYFRFTKTLGPTRLETGAAELLDRVQPIIDGVYADALKGIPLRVSIRVERGSTKAWITITTLTGALIFYGDIRQSIDYLISDAKRVANWVAPVVGPSLELGSAEPAYRQRRLGVPGQLERLFQSVERHDMSSEEATQRAVDLLYRQAGPQALIEAPGITERLSRELRIAGLSSSSRSRQRRRLPQPHPPMPLIASETEPIPGRRRSGVVASRDSAGKVSISTY